MTATPLWLRSWSLVVDTTAIDANSLDFSFEVTRSITHTPNKASVKVYNLSPTHRGQLTRLHRGHHPIFVEIHAGYQSQGATPPRIFRGNLRSYKEIKQAGDYVSEIEGHDGGRQFVTARFSRAYPPGTPIGRVLTDLAASLGLGPGNVATLGAAQFGNRTTFPDGVVIHGSAASELRTLLRGARLTYSIQSGALQLLPFGQAIQSTALVLSPGSGLLEATHGKHNRVEVKTLLTPDLYPGRYLDVRGKIVQGFFRAHTVKYSGDTSGGDWTADASCDVLHTAVP